jgi:hypothetical protein
MAEGKGYEVALQVVVAAYGPVGGHHYELLVVRPSKSLYGAFIPLGAQCQQSCFRARTFWGAYVDAPDQLAGATVYIDARFGSLVTSVGVYFILIAVYG